MGIKELLIKIRREREEIINEIAHLQGEIIRKESDDKVFIANTLSEKAKIRRLLEKLN